MRWIFAIRIVLVTAALALALAFLPDSSFFPRTAYGPILHEEESKFSQIRVRGNESKRHLLFVSQFGKEQLQSSIDLARPGELQVSYTQGAFCFVFVSASAKEGSRCRPRRRRHDSILDQHFPDTNVEAVEIDPAVVSIASEYFETKEKSGVSIHTEDAFDFLRRKQTPYDVIYMDAFLRPSVDRDVDGKTARLKTVAFLSTVRDQLIPDGLLACNLIAHRESTKGDVAALREVFPTVLLLPVSGTGNMIAFASKSPIELSKENLIARGKELEKSLPIEIPFAAYAEELQTK